MAAGGEGDADGITEEMKNLFCDGDVLAAPGAVMMKRVYNEDLESATPEWVSTLLYLDAAAAMKEIQKLPDGVNSLERLPPNARKVLTQHLMPNQGAAAEFYREMIRTLREDVVVVPVDATDSLTHCRAARILKTPEFLIPYKVEVEFFNVYEKGMPQEAVYRKRSTLPPSALQPFEMGDSLTSGALPKPLPVDDREAVYRHWHRLADAGLKALGPRPGTGESAVDPTDATEAPPSASAAKSGKKKGGRRSESRAERLQRQERQRRARAVAQGEATEMGAGVRAAAAADEERQAQGFGAVKTFAQKMSDVDEIVSEEVQRRGGGKEPKLYACPAKQIESAAQLAELAAVAYNELGMTAQQPLSPQWLDWALIMCYIRGKISYLPARTLALRVLLADMDTRQRVIFMYAIEGIALGGWSADAAERPQGIGHQRAYSTRARHTVVELVQLEDETHRRLERYRARVGASKSGR